MIINLWSEIYGNEDKNNESDMHKNIIKDS